MSDPGPSAEELNDILKIATRIPDHGKLSPFYFIVFEGEKRAAFGKHLRAAWAKDHPDATVEQLQFEENRLTRAPMVVCIVSRIREAKIPAWEQILSAGACCYNLCLAANAYGYGANWLSEWYSYHPDIRCVLGLEDGVDNIAGFIYIGTETQKQDERNRPDVREILNYWDDSGAKNKGDLYSKSGVGRPEKGFTF